VIDLGAADVLKAGVPTAAEAWGSHLLGMFETARMQARLEGQDVPPLEEAMLEVCAQRRDRNALVVAVAMAAVLPPPLDERSKRVAADLGRSVAGPSWLDEVGRAAPTRAWVAADVFGDQDALIVGFAQPGEKVEHAVVALVDHNLSGQAKDAWIADDLDEVVEAWRSSDDHMGIDEIPTDAALARLRDAMAASDLWNGDIALRTDDFAENRAFIWARLRRAGHGSAKHAAIEVPQPERDRLVAGFLASEPGQAVCAELHGTDVELLVHHLVDLRSDYEGRPLRWSPNVVGLVLVDLAPSKLLLDPVDEAALPNVLRAFVRYAAGLTGLEAAFLAETLAAVDDVEPAFLATIGDPAAAGPAKAVLAALMAKGVSLDDPDAVNAALSKLGPMPLPAAPKKKKPKTTAATAEVIEAAAGAPGLARLAALVDFYGDGRKLTQKGQPTLADARTLVGLLGTGDRFDEVIGDRKFTTQSAGDLPELGFTIRWALAAGALRKEHGKLRATVSWRKLEAKPLERWTKAANALSVLGPLAAFYASARYRGTDEFLDGQVPELLFNLLDGPEPFDAVLDDICECADTLCDWLVPYMQDPVHRRTSFGYDLDRLVRILGWAAIVERVAATVEPDEWARHEKLVGGTLQLTAVGRWWMEGS